MAFAQQLDVDFTTTAGGAATVYSIPVTGRVLEIRYDYGDGDTGLDATITGESSGKAILTVTNAGTADVSWRPRQVVHTTAETGAGAAVTFDGTNEIYEPIWIVGERIKIVIAQGGNAKVGQFEVIVG